jgi:hypothetical protein
MPVADIAYTAAHRWRHRWGWSAVLLRIALVTWHGMMA